MAAESARPLRWEESATPCHSTQSDRLPQEVVTCLENARFLHLATCTSNIPHVSLMKFTYLPSHPFPSTSTLPPGPAIVMTSNPSSKKTSNLLSNPNVSLLVHDWVSSRPPNTLSGADRERSPTGGPRSSLAQMLMQMNSTAVSSISATINGSAHVLASGTPEEKWCKEQHLANNTFDEDQENLSLSRTVSRNVPEAEEDGGRESYIDDEGVRVVIVRIRDGRISDWKGGVKDWVITGSEGSEGDARVNGVV
ncbi:hypothetical protein M409DRAFT_57824 [Zasmidium cellare ATCC 36951]|uniref:Pyridoxamine 5'-phosphate oxidase N-terminal domain-containing protein n=1 Tax=Zasmidium cellare ATCC 36951 TaxID=1080233 RepID=A0A6A6C800_ZASCE|nr:uncharacterized protein M409DRAFT_57824 [Zasmidium cellare ATCC 36951]KAF2163161.1 hypothetical protein M409DRAFT_57824 [Zasmidium cellare ATCC 36951]